MIENGKPYAIYAGSFDPFTVGHMDILIKASQAYNVIVCIASNKDKKNVFTLESRLNAIITTSRLHYIKFDVNVCDGLVAKFCKENNIKFSIRGLRSFLDFGYEENLAKINQKIYPELETVYFRASQKYDCISSSFVREMIAYKEPVSEYLPYPQMILRTN